MDLGNIAFVQDMVDVITISVNGNSHPKKSCVRGVMVFKLITRMRSCTAANLIKSFFFKSVIKQNNVVGSKVIRNIVHYGQRVLLIQMPVALMFCLHRVFYGHWM